MVYPELLQPNAIEQFLISEQIVEIPKVILTFKKWMGIPFKNTFGGKPLIDVEGVAMFAELAISEIFNLSGWQSRWVETYGAKATAPYHFSKWADGNLKEQVVDAVPDEKVLSILNNIASINGNTYAGCWDIVGWQNDNILFAESKWAKKDSLRSSQNKWLAASLKSGLTTDNFLVIQWTFDTTNKPSP